MDDFGSEDIGQITDRVHFFQRFFFVLLITRVEMLVLHYKISRLFTSHGKREKKSLVDRKKGKTAALAHSGSEMSLPTYTVLLSTSSNLLHFLHLFLFQVNVELMHCLFPPKTVAEVFCSRNRSLFVDTPPKEWWEKSWAGAMKECFTKFFTNLKKFFPKICIAVLFVLMIVFFTILYSCI